ncbi:hypothetical protein [Oceanobacillus jeddahense]|uniref:hypothetical protein n=1 Tax=Oceanobacillus jeddahense TaxID=1462527 RepID=UPI000694B1D0|nr:hypothetical protein [Oceanobacillus jeddahense]
MNDLNVRTEIKQSEINGLFQEVEQLKKDRTRMKETIDKKTEKIISHILKNGNVLAYKNDMPHVLTVKNVEVKKFDKSALAADLDMTAKELNLIGVAELVERNRITSERLKEYEFYENDQRLKVTKAKKRDMELILGGPRI